MLSDLSISEIYNLRGGKGDYQSLAITILKIGCLAVGLALMDISYKGSPLGSWLLMNQGWDNTSILFMEKLLIPVIGVILFLLIRSPSFYNTTIFAGIILGYACLEWVNGGKPMLFWSVLAHLSKVILPFILYLLSMDKRYELSEFLFKGAIALIFISHGIAAILHHPVYIDYIISFGHRINGAYLSETQARYILTLIGWIDIIGGVAILFLKNGYLLGWLMFWGFITALWRVVDTSLWNFESLLIRSPHYLLPLAYYIWIHKRTLWRADSDVANKVVKPN